MNTKGIPKHKVLKALYDHSFSQGSGIFEAVPGNMKEETAVQVVEAAKPRLFYFDYVNGRVIKVSLANDNQFDERLYDRDVGVGAAQAAINSII